MVKVGAFIFELVEATTKIPYKEHYKDGKTYVEAEPGAEYFISVQKVAKTEKDLHLSFSIDGGTPSAALTYGKQCIDNTPYIVGLLRNEANGSLTHTSLMFVKPRISDSSVANPHLCMGKVEIKMSEFSYTGRATQPTITNTFTAASVDMNQADGAAKKKNLRSDKGTTSLVKEGERLGRREIVLGTHVDTATLNYCAALGLMEVGVLKKPSMWEYERMKNPAQPDSNPHAVQQEVGSDGVIDLLVDGDSDDEY